MPLTVSRTFRNAPPMSTGGWSNVRASPFRLNAGSNLASDEPTVSACIENATGPSATDASSANSSTLSW